MNKSALRLLCEDYCRTFPKMKDLTLAKKIFNENRKKCRSVEQVRSLVRTAKGHNGQYHREVISDKSYFTPVTYDTTAPKRYKEEISTSAKVLILDIETAPIRAYVWNIWNQNIGLNQIESDWFCLTWSAKWLFDDKVYGGKLTGEEAIREDDKRIIQGVWEMINKADIVIAHNGDKFDMPKLNTRFLIHGLQPPLPYQSIDTLKHIRKQFGFTSNKLDYVNKILNLPRKKEHEGMPLWVKCIKGDDKSLQEMYDYNVEDVKILEETYLVIRPWIKPHPNMGLFILDEHSAHCPSCGSADLADQGKPYMTTVNAYEVFRCNNCGATGRRRKCVSMTPKVKNNILSSIPR